MGHEDLMDLQALCDPCHRYLSARTTIDPVTDGVAVYLAGPITNAPWRLDLFTGGLTEHEGGPFVCPGADYGDAGAARTGMVGAYWLEWPHAQRRLRGGFDFVGPYYCDTQGGHGTDTGNGHGRTEHPYEPHNYQMAHKDIVALCQAALTRSDIVFAWIERLDHFATLWELGYAAALGKVVAVAFRDDPHETHEYPATIEDACEDTSVSGQLWFAEAAAEIVVFASTPGAAWREFQDRWQSYVRFSGRRAGMAS
jgi:hypothetical protein